MFSYAADELNLVAIIVGVVVPVTVVLVLITAIVIIIVLVSQTDCCSKRNDTQSDGIDGATGTNFSESSWHWVYLLQLILMSQ